MARLDFDDLLAQVAAGVAIADTGLEGLCRYYKEGFEGGDDTAAQHLVIAREKLFQLRALFGHSVQGPIP